MKHIFSSIFLFVTLFAFAQKRFSNLQYVDATIGGVGLILEPTRPTVHLPNSMVRVFPSRRDELDDQISYFPLTISSHRQPSLFSLMPFSGKPSDNIWRQRLSYDQETSTPYYYLVTLMESGDRLDFTPSHRSGIFRIEFARDEDHYLRMGVINNNGEIITEGKRIIKGTENFNGMKAYFYGKLNTDIQDIRYRSNADQKQALIQLSRKPAIAEFRYGVSFISIEQAKENLEKEIDNASFGQVKGRAYSAWDKVLSQVDVKGGTDAQKRVFYTSLYRCYERMIDINESGKYYSAYDHKVHQSDRPFYVDNWLWDTYIALEPLHTILNPVMQEDKIRSYISMYEQSGWMPSFALSFGDNPCMTGNHAAAWFADSWVKGLRNFDVKKAYEGVRKNSLEATLLPWRNGPATSLDSFYNSHGYMPALKPGEKETVAAVHGFERRQAVAVTLENSLDDWCIAQLARLNKSPEDEQLFMKRAAFYKNVFRADKGFMWPKDAGGSWIEPFDPKFSGGMGGRDYTTENNVYTYNWHVKHDLKGLFELMGGMEKAEAKLDQLFREDLGHSRYQLWATFPDATGLVGQFVMGNEPSFHIPYIYNYLGAPWKTQSRIRMLLDTWFTDNLFGIPGDEDGGGMTAFVVFSMMGFFPVTPGVPVYAIGSPVFEKITVKLPGGRHFIIDAKGSSAANKYIQSAKLNGRSLTRSWFTHQDLMTGGVLEFNMSKVPNKEWGRTDLPPSSIGLESLALDR